VSLTILVSRHRRLLTAVFAAAAVAFALSALRPAPQPGVRILTAARDLPSGATLRTSDLHSVTMPSGAVPDGAVRFSPAGRVLAGPMRRGEPLTDARLIGRQLLSGYGPDLVAVPIRMADAGSVGLLRPGDRIDVLTTPGASEASGALDGAEAETAGAGARARQVLSPVPVIAVVGESPDDAGGLGQGAEVGTGALVVVAARRDQAATLAGSAFGSRLSFVIVK
jgi:Flp pilus assembly protein CpaB